MFTSRQAWGFRPVCLLFFSLPAFSQSSPAISGCVQDQTRLPIAGATVALTRSDDAGRFQAQTGEKGCFAVNVRSGNYRLRILADGFAPFEKEVAVESSLSIDDVVLQVQGVEATAVVTATRSLASTNDVASSVDVIDREQIACRHS